MDGRLLDPRPYFSGNIGDRQARVDRFDLTSEQDELRFDLVVTGHMGEISFESDPVDAAVTFEVEVESRAEGAGVFLGSALRIAGGRPVTVSPDDPRVAVPSIDFQTAAPGCYIRAVLDASAVGPRAHLSPEAIQRLKELGYIEEQDSEQ